MADQGVASNLSPFWKAAIDTVKNDLTLSPILKATTRQGIGGFSVWHNPFFNMPHVATRASTIQGPVETSPN
jgi:hypothetical protein